MNNRTLSTNRTDTVFNSPLECGLRSTVLLTATFPAPVDIQRLVQYDYLLVHSGDVEGPASLHPATPHRSGELLIKRPLIEEGVKLMMRKSIIACSYSDEGIRYVAGEWAIPFLGAITHPYVGELRQRATWVVAQFGRLKDEEIKTFMQERWNNWGSEFEYQSLFQSDDE